MHHLIHFRFSLLPRTLVVLLLLALFGLAPVQSTYAATIIVNNTADNLTASDGLCTLREAISNANSDSDTTGGDCVAGSGADIITLPTGTYTLSIAGTGEDANATGDLDITSNLTINGDEAIVQAGTNNTNGIDRVFHVVSTVNVTLNNLTIRYGRISGEAGGGILNVGTLNLDMSAVSENTGDTGGGINNSSGTITITSSTVNNNSAGFGGGITNFEGTITLDQSTVSGNTATSNGGGVDSDGFGAAATLNVYNSTLSNNSAGFAGGGILAYSGGAATVVNLENSTIHNNNAPSGGLASWNNGSGATINLQNSIVADQAGATADCVSITGGTFVSNNYNLDSDSTCNLSQPNDIPGATANLGTLQDNGGATNTHALLAGSQAINVIPDGTNGCGTTYTSDQREVSRPQGTACDIGAYELVTAVSPTTNGGLGPGGVGHTDGTTTLELWLRADKGVFSDNGCTTSGSDGNTAGCWRDQSGNNFNFTNPTVAIHPVYEVTETGINSQPSLQFTNDRLAYTNFPALTGVNNYVIYGVSRHNGDGNSLIGGVQTGNTGHGLQVASWGGGNNVRFLHRMPFAGSGGNDLITTGNAYTIGTPHIVTAVRNFSGSLQSARIDGGTPQSLAASVAVFSSNLDIAVGNRSGGANTGHPLNGYIGEVIIFTEAPTDVRRLLVENYLSSKYNLTIPGSNDFYDGDTVGNGDFDLDVAGIGRFGSNNHTQSHAAGMIVVNSSFLQDNGDWLLFGHRTATNGNSTADLPTTGDWATAPAPQRWERHFYIDVTDAAGTTGGTVDIIFDYSEGEMDGNLASFPGGPISNYRLLKRTGTSGQFSDIATATAIVGDQVHFQGVDVSLLGSNFTLGSLDDGASPTAVSLQTISSNTGVIPAFIVGLLLLTLVGTSLLVLRRKQTM